MMKVDIHDHETDERTIGVPLHKAFPEITDRVEAIRVLFLEGKASMLVGGGAAPGFTVTQTVEGSDA